MKLQIQPRDVLILKDVFKYRAVASEQIRARFFPNCSKVNAFKRIRELESAGYLKHFCHRTDGRPQHYVEATAISASLLKNSYGYRVDRPHVRSESPLHDLRFSEVGHRLETLQVCADLLTENIMQSSQDLAESDRYRDLVASQSDAALTLKAPDGKKYLYAVEFELSKKTLQRYREKLATYYINPQIQGILYVCSTQKTINALARANDDVRGKRKSILYAALESDVMKATGKIKFCGSENTILEFF